MKHRSLYISLISAIIIFFASCGSTTEKVKYLVFETSMGEIKLMLFNETPGHKENIIKLVKEGFYDGVKFHRILSEFMIQGGDPTTKDGITDEAAELYNYTIPAEINKDLFHKKGVLAAARSGDRFNPDRKSSGTQFYIVQGRAFNDEELNMIEQRVNNTLKEGIYYKNLTNERKRVVDEGDTMTDAEIQEFASVITFDEIAEMTPFVISEERREIYKTTGGSPHLDTQYTIFGEVVEGLDIVDAIAGVETDKNGKPSEDILIISAKITRK